MMEAGAQKPILPTAAKIGEKAEKNGPPKGDDYLRVFTARKSGTKIKMLD
jgi:hypothetical protein